MGEKETYRESEWVRKRLRERVSEKETQREKVSG